STSSTCSCSCCSSSATTASNGSVRYSNSCRRPPLRGRFVFGLRPRRLRGTRQPHHDLPARCSIFHALWSGRGAIHLSPCQVPGRRPAAAEMPKGTLPGIEKGGGVHASASRKPC